MVKAHLESVLHSSRRNMLTSHSAIRIPGVYGLNLRTLNLGMISGRRPSSVT